MLRNSAFLPHIANVCISYDLHHEHRRAVASQCLCKRDMEYFCEIKLLCYIETARPQLIARWYSMFKNESTYRKEFLSFCPHVSTRKFGGGFQSNLP